MWLGGNMDQSGRPPARVVVLETSYVSYAGQTVFLDLTVTDHFDIVNEPKEFEWACEIFGFSHRFGLKIHLRPMYISPLTRVTVLMVDDFGGAYRAVYGIPQAQVDWSGFGWATTDMIEEEFSGNFQHGCVLQLRPCRYSQEP